MCSYTSRPLSVQNKLWSEQAIEELVLAEVLGACNLDVWPEGLDWNTTFDHLGVKSLPGVLLRDRLGSLTGLRLPTTLLYNYTSPAAVSAYLYHRLLKPNSSSTQQAPEDMTATKAVEPIAIISMACRFPGGVTSPEDLWRVVADGVDVTSEFPDDVSIMYPPTLPSPLIEYSRGCS